MTLKVGLFSSALANLHKTLHVDYSVFITAFNPFSCVVDDDINIARQALLKQDLLEQGLIFIEGIGRHPSGNWPGEPSLLVLGVPLKAAENLGTRYEQNAVIWNGLDAVPQLMLLR